MHKKQSITAVQLRTSMQEKEKTAAVCVIWAKLIILYSVLIVAKCILY